MHASSKVKSYVFLLPLFCSLPFAAVSAAAPGPVQVTTTVLPPATPGVPYSAVLSATGGAPPYSNWAIVSGTLPAGLALNAATGVISGTPATLDPYGETTLEVTVEDSAGNLSVEKGSTIDLALPITVLPQALPAGYVGYGWQGPPLMATGGTGEYTWKVSSGSLPPGLTLVGSGSQLRGVPTTAVGSPFNFSVTASDGFGRVSAPQSFSISIIAPSTPAPVISSINPSSAPVGSPSVTITISGTGFVNGSVALLNNLSLVTAYVNSTTLTAQIPAGDLLPFGGGFINVVDPSGGPSNLVTFTITPGVPLEFLTVAPCRIMDTRNQNGPLRGPFVSAGTIRTIPIPSSACGLPATAVAYSLNFTVVPRGPALEYLTVWATGQPQPFVSTLNSLDGSIIANSALVAAGDAGAINAFATDDTDLIVDINGYFVPPTANSLQFYPMQPCRVLDTRNPAGTFGGPSIDGGTSRSFPIPSSACGVPANAAAYAFNVTVVPQDSLSYLTAWPTGQTQPFVSTLNSFDGTVLANAAIVPAGDGGAVSFFATDTTDLVVDINSFFAPPGSQGPSLFGGLYFYTLTPCRVVDTRNPDGPLGGPSIGAGMTRAFSPGSPCGLPGANTVVVEAYSLNITAIPQGVLGYLSISGFETHLAVSTLNAYNGQVVANAAIVPLDYPGYLDVFVTGTTDVVIDTNGYFAPL